MPAVATDTAQQHTQYECSECAVVAKLISGEAFEDLPAGWVEESGEVICLKCSQRRTQSLARTGDPAAREAVVALVEKELVRRPNAETGKLAAALGVSRQIVSGARLHLEKEGTISDGTKTKPDARRTVEREETRERIENELRENPARANSEVAKAAESSPNTARRIRERMGIPAHDARETARRLTVATLESLGTVTNESFSQATGGSYAECRNRLEALVSAGLATKTRNNGGKGGSEKYKFALIDADGTGTATQPTPGT